MVKAVRFKAARVKRTAKRSALIVAAFTIWTLFGFYAAQFLLVGIIWALAQIGVDFSAVNTTIFNTVTAAVVYIIALTIVIGGPWVIKKYRTTKEDVGLQRLPSWTELGLAPAGLIVYFITSALVTYMITLLVSGFDPAQTQNVGFEQLGQRYEYILAFVTLVIIAPIAEEILFRGYLYGKLKKYSPRWVAIIVTSALFGFAHGQWNVAIDTFILSLFLCALRDITGSLWPSIILHMLKNGIAYYFLFVNPTIIQSLQ